MRRMNRNGAVVNAHVIAVIENEWSQMRRNRVIVFTTFAPPVLFMMLAVTVLVLSSWIDVNAASLAQLHSALIEHVNTQILGVDTSGALQVAVLRPFLMLFEMLPIVVPLTVASYSISGERQTRSLEALLATPIKTWELLLAKMMAAVLPGLAATWVSFAVFVLVARFTVDEAVYLHLILSPTWLVTITVMTPVLTMFAVATGILISSKVKDPQSAQQLGSLVVLPVVGLMIGQIVGAVTVDVTVILRSALALGFIDILLMIFAVNMFQRETILTRWR